MMRPARNASDGFTCTRVTRVTRVTWVTQVTQVKHDWWL